MEQSRTEAEQSRTDAERSRFLTARDVSLAFQIVAGTICVTLGMWFNFFYTSVNFLTGQETHPYALVGLVLWFVGLVCFGGVVATSRS